MALINIKLGDYIEQSTTNNKNLAYGNEFIVGVNSQGIFTAPKGNTEGVDLQPYKIVKNLTIQQKEILWNCLKDLTHRHRKFTDADWFLPEERLVHIDEFAMNILPNCEHAFLLRLFRKDQYSLMDETDSYLDDEQELQKQQIELVKQKYTSEKITGIFNYKFPNS